MKNRYLVRLNEILEIPKEDDKTSKLFDSIIIILIVLNVFSVIISSMKVSNTIVVILKYFEYLSVVIFTLEYLLRLLTASIKYSNYKHPNVKYFFSFFAVIDLLAILPFYVPFIIMDLRFLRILRLFRALRIFKLNRYNNSMEIIVRVLNNEKDKLITSLYVCVILLIFSASLIYFIENEAQPELFPDIPSSIWWAVATLTTVGYGDVYPITNLGKIVAGIIALIGIGFVALPTGIISSGFIIETTKNRDK